MVSLKGLFTNRPLVEAGGVVPDAPTPQGSIRGQPKSVSREANYTAKASAAIASLSGISMAATFLRR